MTRRSAIPDQTSPYVVYGFRDETGAILYIGQTNNLRSRVYAHRAQNSAFIRHASTVDVLGGAVTREQVMTMESLLISSVHPPYNTQYNAAERDAA